MLSIKQEKIIDDGVLHCQIATGINSTKKKRANLTRTLKNILRFFGQLTAFVQISSAVSKNYLASIHQLFNVCSTNSDVIFHTFAHYTDEIDLKPVVFPDSGSSLKVRQQWHFKKTIDDYLKNFWEIGGYIFSDVTCP